jgi:hypothetical protein
MGVMDTKYDEIKSSQYKHNSTKGFDTVKSNSESGPNRESAERARIEQRVAVGWAAVLTTVAVIL